MLIASSSTVTITTFKELVAVDILLMEIIITFKNLVMVVILLTETIIAHTNLEVIMGFIDGFFDLCESTSRRISKEM